MEEVLQAAKAAAAHFQAGRYDDALAVLAAVKQGRSDDPKVRHARARWNEARLRGVAAAAAGRMCSPFQQRRRLARAARRRLLPGALPRAR
jgi:hypothetical protein